MSSNDITKTIIPLSLVQNVLRLITSTAMYCDAIHKIDSELKQEGVNIGAGGAASTLQTPLLGGDTVGDEAI